MNIHTIHTNVQSNLDLGGFRLICGNTKGILWLCTKGSDRGSKKQGKKVCKVKQQLMSGKLKGLSAL